MDKIKSFIYLDNKKMYSLASQIFEGLVESYIEREKNSVNEIEEQSGPLGSGRKLADIMKTEKDKSENKFLHDYLYNMFEKKLYDLGKVIDLADVSIKNEDINTLNFVKVKGKAIFNDSRELIKTISQYNNLGNAFSYVTLAPQKSAIELGVKKKGGNIRDAFKKEVEKQAKLNGLCLDDEYIEKIQFIMNYGLDDMFEIQIRHDDCIFSSCLNRDYLNEKEKHLISKFSRATEVELTLFGVVTQSFQYTPTINVENNFDSEGKNFKELFRNMVNAFTGVENTFIGKASGEIILDPISLYVEL